MIDTAEALHPTLAPCAELLQAMRTKPFHSGMYRTFRIPKASGGWRTIVAPNAELMAFQQELRRLLGDHALPGSTHAHAYYYGRSIRTMADPHVGRAVVVKMDLADFFPRIEPYHVRNALLRRNVDSFLMSLITKWCFRINDTDGLPFRGLPIGAPTSPLLSNLVAADRIDPRLAGLVRRWNRRTEGRSQWREHDIAYTRYADDLVFSSDDPDLGAIVPAVRRILESAGFRVNERKIHILRRGDRQVVCGVVVNSAPGAPRPARTGLRHELYRLACDIAQGRCRPGERIDRLASGGLPVVEPLNFARLAGRLAHVRWLKPTQARDLTRLYDRLVDLHRPPSEQQADTVAWRRRQEARCTANCDPETPSSTPSSTET